MVEIGNMRSVVQFKINTPTAKGAGFEDSWSDYGTVRGSLTPKSGRRTLLSGEIDFFNYYELIVRNDGLYTRPDMMAVIDGREFTIDSGPIHIEEAKKTYLKFTLTEKLNA